MPYKARKLKGGKYRGKWGGRTVAKRTTKKKMKRQKRLLYAVEHGWKPTGRKAKR